VSYAGYVGDGWIMCTGECLQWYSKVFIVGRAGGIVGYLQ